MLRRSNNSDVQLRRRQLLVNLVVVAASICLSLIVVELVLRSIIPSDIGRPFEFRIPHPVYGWVLKPGATYSYQLPEAMVSISYNSQGWRDIEHPVDKPDDVFRILVLGDSFMEATSVDLSQALPRRVEQLARDSGYNVEVINLGVAGYGTLQEYLVYHDIGQLYEPDLVLLGFFDGNDLMNNSSELATLASLEQKTPNTLPFLDPSAPTQWVITPVDFEAAQKKYAEYQADVAIERNSLTHKVFMLRLAREALNGISIPDLFENGASDPVSSNKESQELAVLGVNYCEEPGEYTRAWGTTQRILEKLRDDVETHGGELVVFTVPAIEEVSPDHMRMVAADVAHPGKLCFEKAPGHARLGGILSDLDIEFIPLLSDFRTVMRDKGVLLYRLSDQHWNPEGHALAAEQIVSELIERELLPVTAQAVKSTP